MREVLTQGAGWLVWGQGAADHCSVVSEEQQLSVMLSLFLLPIWVSGIKGQICKVLYRVSPGGLPAAIQRH